MPESRDDVWTVVVARVAAPKSRLAGVLDEPARRQLALAMLGDVLDTCVSCRNLSGVLAVVDTTEAAEMARQRGAGVLQEPPLGFGGMNAAARAGIAHAQERGATTVIVLPGDVPFVSHADIAAVLDAAGQSRKAVVIGVSRDGGGTNALLLRPPDVIAPSFGPPSVDRHAALGWAAGAQTSRLRGLDLALDVDTPDDMAVWRTRQRRTSPSLGRSSPGVADSSR